MLKEMSDVFLCCYMIILSFYDLQIETRNNKLEMQSVNNTSLIAELDKLLERLRVPSEVCYPSPFLVDFISVEAILTIFHCYSMQHL